MRISAVFSYLEHVRSHIASSAAAEQQKQSTENDSEDREYLYAAECRRWKDEYDRLLLTYMADPEPEPMDLEIHFCEYPGMEKYFPGYCGGGEQAVEWPWERAVRKQQQQQNQAACAPSPHTLPPTIACGDVLQKIPNKDLPPPRKLHGQSADLADKMKSRRDAPGRS